MIRAPQPGAPFAYVTTRKFPEAFGLAALRDLPDLERLKAEGLMQGGQGEDDLDSALRVMKVKRSAPTTPSWIDVERFSTPICRNPTCLQFRCLFERPAAHHG